VLPLAMLPSIDQATAQTGPLPFLNMSVTALPLSPAAGLNTNAKCSHLWRFRHKSFSPVCAQMRWMRLSLAPAAMTSPAGPYCTHKNFRVKARRVPSARSVVCNRYCSKLQDEIHDVGLAKQAEQTHPKHDARVAARLHGTQRSGTNTASCDRARSRRLHSGRTPGARALS
jgi:hypothetical protein